MSFGKFAAAAFLLAGAHVVLGQAPTEGIRIDDALTISRCGGCHRRDASGMMSRLSYIRTSPEVWDQSIKRMVRLNGLMITPKETHDILRFLSRNNGLAPEEMKPGFWEVEHRTTGYQGDYVPNPVLQKTCNNCHNIGRVLSQRRTRGDYEKLVAMHIGMFPSAQNVLRPAMSKGTRPEQAAAHMNTSANGGVAFEAPRATPSPADGKQPSDLAIDYLAKAQPLITPEWTAWKGSMRAPKIAGTWMLTGYQPGKGKIYGKLTITPGSTDDQFSTSTEFSYVTGGTTVKMTGKSVLYTGYSWRGHSMTGTTAPARSLTASATPVELREAMMLSRDGESMEGRWFWSSYGELGMDVHLKRLGSGPLVLGADVNSLQSPSKSQVKIFGANLPAGLKPADIDLGPGVTATRVMSSTPTLATVEIEVAKGSPVGQRDLSVGGSTAVEAVAVYDQIAYIEVTPDANISRLGGMRYPKEYSQFEAIAWAAGPDGIPNTEDDVWLGPVAARWGLEEFVSTPGDDDIKFVGIVDDSGLFTPSVEGINPARKKQEINFSVNNYGDVWVAATYAAPDGKQFKAKAYLVVTIPNYSIYDQPEVSQ